jgi:hypothetical protein
MTYESSNLSFLITEPKHRKKGIKVRNPIFLQLYTELAP